MATTRKLTAKQTALMTAIGEKYFSFFDDGIVEGGGIWSDALTGEIAGSTKYDVSDTPKGAARVMVSLEKRGLLAISGDESEGDDGVWVELTAEGAKVANELAETAKFEAEVAEIEDEDLVGQIQTEGSKAVGAWLDDTIEAFQQAAAEADEAIQAIVEHSDVEVEEAGSIDAEGNSLTVTTTHSTDTYTVREWTDGDDVEWTETDFADGSRTIKRRKKVSGSWRTDYWGAEFKGDAERYTTAKFAKMARAYGSFSHNPISE